MIIPKAKKNLDSLTVLEREKELSRLQHETEELVDEMGQRSDVKAIGTVRKYVQEQQAQQELQKNLDQEKLKQLSKNKISYQRYLVVVLQRYVKEEDIPRKYKFFIESNDTGIILGIEGTDLYTAFKVCGIPIYDIVACKLLAIKLGNTTAKLEGYTRTTQAGIALPDSLDKKKYGRK